MGYLPNAQNSSRNSAQGDLTQPVHRPRPPIPTMGQVPGPDWGRQSGGPLEINNLFPGLKHLTSNIMQTAQSAVLYRNFGDRVEDTVKRDLQHGDQQMQTPTGQTVTVTDSLDTAPPTQAAGTKVNSPRSRNQRRKPNPNQGTLDLGL